jgi:hypothetical protein
MCNNKNSIYMKTSTTFLTKPNKLLLYWCLSILLTSCGSYQNSSYYDSDGIYGSTPRSAVQKKHKALLRTNIRLFSLQNNNQSEKFFTDVDNYITTSKTTLYKTTIIILAGKQPTKRKYQCL